MKRIENNYCWKTIEDWTKVRDMGLIESCSCFQGEDDEKLKHLVHMALHDCFPLQVVCCKSGGKKYLWIDALMRLFWEFVQNKVSIVDSSDKEQYFRDFSLEQQGKILGAKINSVWIDLDRMI